MAATDKGFTTEQVGVTDVDDGLAADVSENSSGSFLTIKVEKIDDGYSEAYETNLVKQRNDGYTETLGKNLVNGSTSYGNSSKVDEMIGIEVTEISEKEKRELEGDFDNSSNNLSVAKYDQLILENGAGHKPETDITPYSCILCKQSFIGILASKQHLKEHLCHDVFDCMECDTGLTLSCILDEHTLVLHEYIGESSEGNLYRYINICQLFVQESSGGDSLTHNDMSDEEDVELEPEKSLLISEKIGLPDLVNTFGSTENSDSNHSQAENTDSKGSIEQITASRCNRKESKGSNCTRTETSDSRNIAFCHNQSTRTVSKKEQTHLEALFAKVNLIANCQFVCLLCFQVFQSSTGLNHHVLTHDKLYTVTCNNCCQPFRREMQLKVHSKRIGPTGCEVHVCTYCNKTFKKRAPMMTHMFVHTKKGAFECPHCKKKWRNQSVLNRHLNSHNSVKEFECSICNKEFSSANSLRVHMNIHTGEKMFPCTICDKVYTEKRFLKVHMCTHTGEGKFICQICSKRFYASSQLKLHMYRHTGERPHVCTICKEAFTLKTSLMRHMYRHNGLKPHSCITCGKSFVLKHDLTEHVKIHAVRPHVCNICKRSFITKAYLNRHLKVHLKRDKPQQIFRCDRCNWSFSSLRSLTSHKASHIVSRLLSNNENTIGKSYDADQNENIVIKVEKFEDIGNDLTPC